MDGFNIFKNYDSIEVFKNNAGIFRLLVEDDEIEVFESTINAGKSVICQPYESKQSMNIVFVLKGKLFYTNKKKYIEAGQRITFKNLKETHHLSILEKTKLLMIRNCKHFIDQASTANKTYDLIHKIQEKDQYTESHCNTTGNLAVQVATLMKLSDQSIQNILYAGKIHDVGKINTPKEILNKPGRLTDKEYEIIKKHCVDGYEIVLENSGNEALAKIVLDHHERLDGSGYPNGLKGDEISIEARILAVVDSYDAMISKRPYKKSISKKEALKVIQSKAGVTYDSAVVALFAEILSYTEFNE